MRQIHALARLVVASTIAGCASAPAPEVTPPPAPLPPPAPAPRPAPAGIVSPARWRVHHPEAMAPTAAHALPQGGSVYGGDGGERWVMTAETGDGGAARGEALILLPERIAAIQPVDGRWAWFGVSGRAFLSATPLGPIDEVRMPPAPVLSVSRGRGAVFAVTRRGDLVRTTDGGAHWPPVPATASWPAAPIAAAFRTDGTGVALLAPQRAFVTTDDGATWAPLSMPGTGPHLLDVSEEGDVWLGRYTGDQAERLSGQPPAFVKAAPPSHDRRRNDEAERYESSWRTERAIVGRRVLAAAGPQEGLKIEVSDLDGEGEWKDVPAFEGCVWISVSASGEDFVAGCARAAADAGAPGGAKGRTPYRAVLYRSKDGVSWAEDGEAPLWDRQIKVIAGPEGSVLLRGECPGGSAGCARLSLRSAAGRPFAPLPLPEDASPEDIAFDPVQRAPLAVERATDKPGHLYRWGPDGSAKRTIDLPGITYVYNFDVDAHGVAVLVAERQEGGSRVLRVADDGSPIDDEPSPSEGPVSHAAFAGDRGLLMDQTGHFWETASGGKAWKPTTGLESRNGTMVCAKEGCVVATERRLGWDLAGEGPAGPTLAGPVDAAPKDRVPGAPPLRCTGAGAAKTIPRAMVRDLDQVATLGWDGGRVTVPAATKDFAVGVAVATLSGDRATVKTQSLFEAAPNPASVGSQTDVRLLPSGVIAARATYPVDGKGADVWISPVSLELAWWRPETQKVERARVPVSGKGQMRGTHELRQGSGRQEILWLGPDAAYFRPHVTFNEASQLHVFTGGGRSTKLATTAIQSADTAIRTASGPVLLELAPPGGGNVILGLADTKEPSIWTLAPPDGNATMVPIARGDQSSLVVAWSGPPDGPPHGYLVPVRPGDDPPEITDLGLAALAGEHPRACTGAAAPGAVRVRVTLPRAARRPVLVEGGDKPALLHADAIVVVVPPQGAPCVSAWLAHGKTSDEGAIIPVAAPAQSVSATLGSQRGYSSEGGVKDLSLRALRCEEAPGLAIPASFEWKGF